MFKLKKFIKNSCFSILEWNEFSGAIIGILAFPVLVIFALLKYDDVDQDKIVTMCIGISFGVGIISALILGFISRRLIVLNDLYYRTYFIKVKDKKVIEHGEKLWKKGGEIIPFFNFDRSPNRPLSIPISIDFLKDSKNKTTFLTSLKIYFQENIDFNYIYETFNYGDHYAIGHSLVRFIEKNIEEKKDEIKKTLIELMKATEEKEKISFQKELLSLINPNHPKLIHTLLIYEYKFEIKEKERNFVIARNNNYNFEAVDITM